MEQLSTFQGKDCTGIGYWALAAIQGIYTLLVLALHLPALIIIIPPALVLAALAADYITLLIKRPWRADL